MPVGCERQSRALIRRAAEPHTGPLPGTASAALPAAPFRHLTRPLKACTGAGTFDRVTSPRPSYLPGMIGRFFAASWRRYPVSCVGPATAAAQYDEDIKAALKREGT